MMVIEIVIIWVAKPGHHHSSGWLGSLLLIIVLQKRTLRNYAIAQGHLFIMWYKWSYNPGHCPQAFEPPWSLLIYILTLLNHIALFSCLLKESILDEHLDTIFFQSSVYSNEGVCHPSMPWIGPRGRKGRTAKVYEGTGRWECVILQHKLFAVKVSCRSSLLAPPSSASYL